MKVLLIDVNCKKGSTGNIVYNLYNYINSMGDEASVCYGRGPIINEKNIYKFGFDLETYLHAFFTRLTGYTGCFSFFSTRRLIKYIKTFKPDVVHIHEMHAYFLNIKPLINYLKIEKIPTIMTLHCEFVYTGKCGHSVECNQWKTECKKCPHLRNYISTFCFDRTNYMFKQKKNLFNDYTNLYLIVPSHWLFERVRESFLKGYRIEIINNGVDTNIFKPLETSDLRKKYGINKDEKIVLALAPNIMSKEKGGLYVEKIAQLLRDDNIKFLFVGTNGDGYYKKDNCIYIGRINDKSILAKHYSLADLFVICSERENFPTTCLEAQVCGTPVYGFDTGGVAETCLNYDYLVNYGDVSLLSKKIKKAPKKNSESITDLSNIARIKFGNQTFLKKNYQIYKKLIISLEQSQG